MDADLIHTMVNNGDRDNDAKNNEILDKLKRIKHYLLILERLNGMMNRAFRAFV